MLTPNQQMIMLGRIRQGEPKSFKYVLTNNTSSVVSVKSLQVGCGSCTTAYMDKSEVAPQESANLNVTFTPSSTGVQTKSVTIKFGDNQSMTLKFGAEVW